MNSPCFLVNAASAAVRARWEGGGDVGEERKAEVREVVTVAYRVGDLVGEGRRRGVVSEGEGDWSEGGEVGRDGDGVEV